MTEVTVSCTCSGCGFAMGAPEPVGEPKKPCPQCGSTDRKIKIDAVEDPFVFHETIGVKGQKIKYKAGRKKKPAFELIAGEDYTVSTGKWSLKERFIDRRVEPKIYRETVINPETGETTHHCDEPLRDHAGHGSDKKG